MRQSHVVGAVLLPAVVVGSLGIDGFGAEAEFRAPPTTGALEEHCVENAEAAVPAVSVRCSAETVAGAQPSDTIRGDEADDLLTGEDSADVVIGAGGDDRMRGMGGDDVLQGGPGHDLLEGGAGSDILEGGEGDDHLRGGEEKDFIFGDEGNDVVRGDDGPDVIDGGAGDDEIDGGDGDDTIDGGDDSDQIRGGPGDDLLDGLDGVDVIFGGPGEDDLDGGDGPDVLRGGDDSDIIAGGDGDDDISGGLGDDALNGGDAADVVRGGPGDDDIAGGDGNDVLFGDAGADLLNGSGGDDRLFGGPEADTLLDGLGNDDLDGGPDADFLRSGVGDDRLQGAAGPDWLEGGRGTDYVNGGAGDDIAMLSAGDVDPDRVEIVEGGSGADTLLLDGFSSSDISAMEERSPPDSAAGPALSFTLTDPLSGGRYLASGFEAIRHVVRLPVADGWGEGTRAVVLNPSETEVAEVEVDFVRTDGTSWLLTPGDSIPRLLTLEIPPGGAAEIDGEGLGVTAPASLHLRGNVGVVPTLQGELDPVGRIGHRGAVSVWASNEPIDFDREGGTATLLALGVDGPARRLHVKLFPEAGGEIDSEEVPVDSNGSVTILLRELFPRVSRFRGTAQIVGGPVHGTIVHVGPGSRGATSVGLAGFANLPEGSGHHPSWRRPLHFPAATSSAGSAILTIVHRTGNSDQMVAAQTPGSATVHLLDREGNVVPIRRADGTAADSVQVTVPVLGREDVVLGERRAELGSVYLRSSSGNIEAILTQSFGAGGAVRRRAATVGAELVGPLPGGASTDVRVLVSSPGQAAEIDFTLRNVEGREVRGGRATRSIGADGSAAYDLAELFPDAETDGVVGSLRVSSSSSIALELVRLLPEAGTGFTLPVVVPSG